MTGDRIQLRDFTDADLQPFIALSHDEAIFTYTKGRITEHFARSDLFVRLLAEPAQVPRAAYTLVIEGPEGFAGYCGISDFEGTEEAEFGWYLRSDQWGRGYASEATRLLLRFGFGPLNRRRMYATADPDNAASIRVLEKSGLVFDGPARHVETWRGLRPRLLFSISVSQWSYVSQWSSFADGTR